MLNFTRVYILDLSLHLVYLSNIGKHPDYGILIMDDDQFGYFKEVKSSVWRMYIWHAVETQTAWSMWKSIVYIVSHTTLGMINIMQVKCEVFQEPTSWC